jgi:hypothetical protein
MTFKRRFWNRERKATLLALLHTIPLARMFALIQEIFYETKYEAGITL